MNQRDVRILAVDPGSVSTKIAVYRNEQCLAQCALQHTEDELRACGGSAVLNQLPMRLAAIHAVLRASGFALEEWDAVAGRGGLLRPLVSGCYRVNEAMLDDVRSARYGEHASNLGLLLALELAKPAQALAIVVDPVSVDEWSDVARFSGLACIERRCLLHALNTKAVARRFAREQQREYATLRLIVAHLGSGISVSAHQQGRMIDSNNANEDGPFSTERAGSLPVAKLVDLCLSGAYTREQWMRMLHREGGLYSYLGTKDLHEVETRMNSGDARARLAFDAMLYQIAKEIGAMAAVLQGNVDAILFTGGMVHSARLVAQLTASVQWIAPVHVYAGEAELEALAMGALRVLRGQKQLLELCDFSG